MSTVRVFSTVFDINPKALDQAGLIDPFIDLDMPLFIDPLLLAKSTNELISTEGVDAFRTHFEVLVRLLNLVEREGDPAWLAAERHLSLREPPENGLGYGRSGRSGSSRPARVRKQVLRTTRRIIQLGSKDPEMISLMGFFEEDVGSDTISDLTTRAISAQLASITSSFCKTYEVKAEYVFQDNFALPSYVAGDGSRKPMVLVPKDIVRNLPVTDGWSNVWEATEHNSELRERVNRLLGGIIAPTVAQQKEALKKAALQSANVFDQFLEAVRSSASSYNPNDDVLGFYALRNLLINNPLSMPTAKYDLSKGPAEVQRIVLDALGVFSHHVEHGNLWEALWSGGQPKWERASQLIFFAVADSFCRANNIDISAEPNMGGGPVDFKFSTGFNSRVLVEMKRSMGTVVSGYVKQLEKYKTAAMTDYAIFVVIDYGGGDQKIDRIMKLQAATRAAGGRASEIVVIDARKKISASKIR